MNSYQISYNGNITITDEDILNILSDATYACFYWSSSYEYEIEDYMQARKGLREPCREEVILKMLRNDMNVFMYVNDKDEIYRLTLPNIINGIKLHLENDGSPDVDDWDGWDADCVMQYAIFGDVIYS